MRRTQLTQIDNILYVYQGIRLHLNPGYVMKAMDRLQHPKTQRHQYAPHRLSVPAYGKRLQMAPDPDNIDLIDKKATKRMNSIVETMIFYARSVDPLMMPEIDEILRVQSWTKPDMAEKSKISRYFHPPGECDHHPKGMKYNQDLFLFLQMYFHY